MNIINRRSIKETNFTGVDNILINPKFTINELNFDSNWDNLTNNELGFNRWYKSGSNIKQTIRHNNYQPSTEYFLSYSTGFEIIVSPELGDWIVEVPVTTNFAYLIKGNEALPIRDRLLEQELDLCESYYHVLEPSLSNIYGYGISVFENIVELFIRFRVSMVQPPSINILNIELVQNDITGNIISISSETTKQTCLLRLEHDTNFEVNSLVTLKGKDYSSISFDAEL